MLYCHKNTIKLSIKYFTTRGFFSLSDSIRNASIKKYSERKILHYSQQQVYNVVSNVNDYQNFIPFCTHSKVYTTKPIKPQQKVMQAELGIGFKLFKEKYMSTVTCQEPHMVTAISADASLFKELVTTWKFLPHQSSQQKCIVDFNISFEFASPLHAQASNVFFDQVSKMMMKAFVDRCHQVYNSSSVSK